MVVSNSGYVAVLVMLSLVGAHATQWQPPTKRSVDVQSPMNFNETHPQRMPVFRPPFLWVLDEQPTSRLSRLQPWTHVGPNAVFPIYDRYSVLLSGLNTQEAGHQPLMAMNFVWLLESLNRHTRRGRELSKWLYSKSGYTPLTRVISLHSVGYNQAY